MPARDVSLRAGDVSTAERRVSRLARRGGEWDRDVSTASVPPQERVEVEQYSRQSGGKWLLQAVDRLEDKITLASVGCEIPLADLYERIFE